MKSKYGLSKRTYAGRRGKKYKFPVKRTFKRTYRKKAYRSRTYTRGRRCTCRR